MGEYTRLVSQSHGTIIQATQESDEVGAVGEYTILQRVSGDESQEIQTIRFKKSISGGQAGITDADLLHILSDRMSRFDEGSCPCQENRIIHSLLASSLVWLEMRDNDRRARGVKGTDQM